MNRYLEDATDDPSEKPRGASVTAALKTRIEKEKKEIYYLPQRGGNQCPMSSSR